MSVIGRLDGQVDDVLIAPLAKRNAMELPRASNKQPSENTVSADESVQALLRTRERTLNEKVRRKDLPVWLL